MSGSVKPEFQRRPGLDSLRVLAALLVFLQHSLSCSHRDHWIDISGFRIGRIGTAMFFLLAGYLASSSRRPPVQWFRERINMLFPAYWIVVVSGFLIAMVLHSKPFDAWQVVCQLSGIGYFTHGERIVNVATWFISPLLLLYSVAMLVRLTPHVQLATVLVLAGFGTVFFFPDYQVGAVECHALTFFLAFLLGQRRPQQQSVLALTIAVLLVGLVPVQPEFRYGAVALLLFSLMLKQTWRNRFSRWFSSIAYEWFLVHGLCVALSVRLTDRWEVVFPVSAMLSLAAAILLQHFVRWMRSSITATKTGSQPQSHLLAGPQSLLHPSRQQTVAELPG